MARHNREGEGEDQRGYRYTVSYQPDWLRHVKVTRALESGRQSTMTLLRNPATRKEAEPGDRIRTRISCPEQGIDVEVMILEDASTVQRVRVACRVPAVDGKGEEEVEFTLENDLPG